MKKIFLSPFLFFFLSLHAQNTEWVKKIGGSFLDAGLKIKLDSAGNIYTTGYFHGTVDFDPGPGITNLSSVGDRDVFVLKLDSSGSLIWARSFGGPSGESGASLVIDDWGNIYTIGSFTGTVDFDPSAGTSSYSSNADSDVFIHKMDRQGNFLWAKTFGGPSFDYGRDLALDGLGNVYALGNFRGAVDFDSGQDSAYTTSLGLADIFVLKLDTSGNFVWAKTMGGAPSFAFGSGSYIRINDLGDIYTVGSFVGAIDFDPNQGTEILNSNGNHDIFIQKLDSLGNLQWAKSFGSSNQDFVNGFEVDQFENLIIAGTFAGIGQFDPIMGNTNIPSNGQEDIFVQKLDSAGNLIWIRSFGGFSSDQAGSLGLDKSGNVYTTGFFYLTADFDPSAGIANLSSAGSSDIFIHKMDSAGNFLWVRSFEGSNWDVGFSVIVDVSNKIYTTGFFGGTVDFNSPVGPLNLTSSGEGDIFFHKMDQSLPTIGKTEIQQGINFSAYPNPSSGKITLSTEDLDNNRKLTIYNTLGVLVFEQDLTDALKQDLELNLAAGTYFVKLVYQNGKSASQPLIIY